MSGNERDPNARLSEIEIETEEMAQELMGMAMYEDGMSYEDMKEILSIINESRNMAGIGSGSRASQQIKKYSPDITAPDIPSKSNLIQEAHLKDNPRPKPSFSYRQALQSSPTSTCNRKSPQDFKSAADSPDSSSDIFDNPKAPQATPDVDSMFEALLETSQVKREDKSEAKIPSTSQLRNPWNTKPNNSQSTHSMESKAKAKATPNQKAERWRLNPLDSIVEDNDVPLQPKKRPVLEEKIPMRFCHVPKALKASEKILAVLNYHLEEVAALWRQNHRDDVTDIQLEAPIQVGTDNGSLDMNPGTEVTKVQTIKENIHGMPERSSKRKASEFIKRMNDESEDANDSDFEIPKKLKGPPKPSKVPKLSRTNSEKPLSRQEKMFNNLNVTKAENLFMIDDCDSDEFDNDNLHSLRRRNAKKQKQTETVVVPLDIYPRRIEPPNPSKPKPPTQSKKTRNATIRDVKRRSPIKRNTRATVDSDEDYEPPVVLHKTSQSSVSLNDDEIAGVLEADEEIESIENDVEIKPLRLIGLATKLSTQQSRLKLAKQKEAKKAETQKQADLRALEEERNRKQELSRKRLLEAEEERKQKEAKEAQQKAREQLWKDNQKLRDRERRRQQMTEKQRREEDEEERLLEDHDDDPIFESNSSMQVTKGKKVNCPICHELFLAKDIEHHAANCDEYINTCEPENSQSPNENGELHIEEKSTYTCNICLRFATSNGIVYEEHVHECLSKQRSSEVAGPSSPMFVEVPTSPIRAFVPISEQTDTEIDYAGQFPKQVKPSKPRGRRKR